MKKLVFFLSLLLVALVPFHALLSTSLLYGLGLNEVSSINFLIKAWKELVIGVLFVSAFWKWRSFERLHYLILGFVALGVVVTLFAMGLDLGALLWGGRTEFGFLLLLFAWSVWFKEFSGKERSFLMKGFLWSAVVALLFGLLLMLVGHDVLIALGYDTGFSTFGVDQAPAFCQMEGGTDFCRLQSSLSGPNRYGGYLLLVLPFLMVFGREFIKKRWVVALLFVLGAFSLYMTVSLSAQLAFIMMFILGVVYLERRLLKPMLWLGLLLLVVGGVLTGVYYDRLFAALSVTDQDHLRYAIDALRLWKEQPWGYGLGFMGPASYKLGFDLVSENWFLQVLVNVGVIGLLLFAWIWGEVFVKLWRNKGLGFLGFVALGGVLFQNLFLHTLEEAAVYVGLMLFICFGLLPRVWFKLDVEKGRGIGRELGFPTVNFAYGPEIHRTFGVYAGKVRFDGKEYFAAINFGSRPTFDDDKELLEAFILNFDDEFAKALNEGYLFEVSLYKKVREVKKFKGIEELKEQITRDVSKIKKLFKC